MILFGPSKLLKSTSENTTQSKLLDMISGFVFKGRTYLCLLQEESHTQTTSCPHLETPKLLSKYTEVKN